MTKVDVLPCSCGSFPDASVYRLAEDLMGAKAVCPKCGRESDEIEHVWGGSEAKLMAYGEWNRMRRLDKERLSKIWDILVQHAGAEERGREMFVIQADEYGRARTLEYRFCGALGFGGKVWLNNGPHPYVNCYREDETKKSLRIIKVTNEALKEMEREHDLRAC